MTVLWAGGEDFDFVTNQMPHNTTSAYRRGSYSRVALWNNLTENLVSVSKIFPGGAVTSCWLSYQYYGFSTRTGPHVGLGKSSSNTKGIFVGPSAGDVTKVCLYKFDGATATALETEAGATMPITEVLKIDMQVIDYGASATVNVYTGGTADPVITYEGDPTQVGCTDLDCVMIRHNAGSAMAASEIIVATEDTRTFDLLTMDPNAAGDANTWTNTYTAIDEVAVSDADTIYTDVAEQEFDCNLSDLPAGSFSVVGLVEAIRACKTDDASIDGLTIGIRSSGETDVGSTETMTTAWQLFLRILQTNPVTDDIFTQAELDALQLALVSKA